MSRNDDHQQPGPDRPAYSYDHGTSPASSNARRGTSRPSSTPPRTTVRRRPGRIGNSVSALTRPGWAGESSTVAGTGGPTGLAGQPDRCLRPAAPRPRGRATTTIDPREPEKSAGRFASFEILCHGSDWRMLAPAISGNLAERNSQARQSARHASRSVRGPGRIRPGGAQAGRNSPVHPTRGTVSRRGPPGAIVRQRPTQGAENLPIAAMRCQKAGPWPPVRGAAGGADYRPIG